MRDAAGELALRLHLLGVAQALLRPLALEAHPGVGHFAFDGGHQAGQIAL